MASKKRKKHLMEILLTYPPEKLANWWCELNRWNWPDEFGKPEPPGEFSAAADSLRWWLMKQIQVEVGDRLISRKWNKEMNLDEFNEFWLSTTNDRIK